MGHSDAALLRALEIVAGLLNVSDRGHPDAERFIEAHGGRYDEGLHRWVTPADRGSVSLSDRDLSALRFAAQFIRGYEQSLEEGRPDDPNPITGTREGEATSDVLAAIVARAEAVTFS